MPDVFWTADPAMRYENRMAESTAPTSQCTLHYDVEMGMRWAGWWQ